MEKMMAIQLTIAQREGKRSSGGSEASAWSRGRALVSSKRLLSGRRRTRLR